MNKVELMGRLVKDVEVKTSKSKVSVATFTLAVDRKGAKEKTTDFIDCVAFGKLIDILTKYTKKGNRVIVTGSLNINHYDDSQGMKKIAPVVVVDDFYFVDYNSDVAKKEDNKDELPFG